MGADHPAAQHPTTDEVLAGIDLTGKVALVTGASAGLGVETARALAAHGATVILAARDAGRLASVAEALRRQTGNPRIDTLVLDLSDLAQIRRAASEALSRFPVIHLLINNAGVMASPLMRTAEGCEWQFGVNHIGHFLFTCLLVPALRAGAPARVVNLSSAGHKYSPVDFDDPHFERRPYDKWLAYGQAKTANALFSVGLTKRLAPFGVTANAVHPGAIVTELGRYLSQEDIRQMSQGATVTGRPYEFITPEMGAATSVWAAVAPELEGRGGLYLEKCRIGEPAEEATRADGYLPYALDPDAAERLWTLSEAITGERFAWGAVE